MLNVEIFCVGGLKEKYLRDACAEYEKRLSAYCAFKCTEIKEALLPDAPSAGETAAALASEEKKISALIKPSAYRIALCSEGTQFTSEAFAKKICDISLVGRSSVCFIIGSSFGMSEALKNGADLKLSFSQMTFPHQLMRVILEEQLYRAFTIINNGKYHK